MAIRVNIAVGLLLVCSICSSEAWRSAVSGQKAKDVKAKIKASLAIVADIQKTSNKKEEATKEESFEDKSAQTAVDRPNLMKANEVDLSQHALVQAAVESAEVHAAKATANPEDDQARKAEAIQILPCNFCQIIVQLLCACVFYATVASKYPQLDQPNDASKAIMQESPICRIRGGPICCQSYLCAPSMIGLLTSKVGLCDFWPGTCVSICFPCCVLWWLQSFSEFKVKMGVEKDDPMAGCFAAFCCACCTVARNVEALDAATGTTTGCCGFTVGAPPTVTLPAAQATADGITS